MKQIKALLKEADSFADETQRLDRAEADSKQAYAAAVRAGSIESTKDMQEVSFHTTRLAMLPGHRSRLEEVKKQNARALRPALRKANDVWGALVVDRVDAEYARLIAAVAEFYNGSKRRAEQICLYDEVPALVAIRRALFFGVPLSNATFAETRAAAENFLAHVARYSKEFDLPLPE